MTQRRLVGIALLAMIAMVAIAAAMRAGADEGAAFELEGSWFVVAHFKDEATNNPEAVRWVDEAWVFAKKGTRMQWSRYPLVVFGDPTGRFETLGRNPRSRVLAAWEPNENQLAEILEGPRVNSRGSKVKGLKKSPDGGWKSTGRMQTASAMVMGYQETWEVAGLDAKPVFTLSDSVGSLTAEGGGGRTRYEVTELGERPSGRYERDGIRHGTFFMIKTPPLRGLEEKEGTVNQRAMERERQRVIEEYKEQLRRDGGAPRVDD